MTAAKKREYDHKYSKDTGYRLNKNVRSFLRKAIKGEIQSSKYEEILGYSIEELKEHLEKRFLPGMKFENYGKWEVDHRTPLVNYEYGCTRCPDFKKAWALENLRPLWAYHNRKRKKKLMICCGEGQSA